MTWECEKCGKKFSSKKRCEKHELECRSIDDRILKGGAILFFGQLGLSLLFGISLVGYIFLGVGGFLMLLAGIMKLSK